VVIGAVLVHFRFWPDVDRTLDALLGQTRPPDAVLVVDDCSGDGSVEALRRARPGLDVLVAPHNRGVIANFNAGLGELRGRGVDAILMLTHETLLEPDALEQLVDRLASEPRVGAVGPLLGFLSRPDTVFSAGGELLARTWQNPHAGMYEPLDAWRGRGVRRVPWLDGACVLVRTAALDDSGLLCERYFHYYDDVELGVRLNQAGWAVECVSDAVARQEPGLLAEYYRVRNRLGFLHATAPRRILARAVGAHLAQAVSDARAPGDGRALAVAQLRAIRDFALGRWGRAPQAFLAARRRDYATGGALHGAVAPTWALPATFARRTPSTTNR
jgi:N-acetylglucosaminyl-diphospho-decaprenol L-rhamnosyltransferase